MKKCNNKAEEIASQDCKQECNVAGPGKDCAKCIMEHKDYNDCKELQCKRNTTLQNRTKRLGFACNIARLYSLTVLEDNKIE